MNSAVEPVPRDAEWLERHRGFVERAKSGNIQVLFLGDSLTDWWRDPEKGAPVWDKYFAGLEAANFGISADRTQHVLWRLRNGEAEGYSPKVIVPLIGTNNTGLEKDGQTPRNTPAEASEGIRAVVEELRHRFPGAKILLLGLFPRDGEGSLPRLQIIQINRALSGLEDRRSVFYLDIGDRFLDENRRIRTDLMPDSLHLSTEGYQVWAEGIGEVLGNLLKGTGG